jgi:hypothetical protein
MDEQTPTPVAPAPKKAPAKKATPAAPAPKEDAPGMPIVRGKPFRTANGNERVDF